MSLHVRSVLPRAVQLGCALLYLAACSSVVGTDALQDDCDGDTAVCCGTDEKFCGDRCVGIRDPEYGCASTSCEPCDVHNSFATCSAVGECIIAACVAGFQDCDRRVGNGCEVDVASDPHNCSLCGNVCRFPGGDGECIDRTCTLTACDPGLASCSESGDTFVTGGGGFRREAVAGEDCETDISLEDNCGGCNVRCDEGEECRSDGDTWSCF